MSEHCRSRSVVNSLQLLIALFLALALSASAQDELLPDGAYGTTIHGGIKAGENKAYLLVGDRGQVFKAHLVTRGIKQGATLELLDSDGESLLGGLERLTKIDALNLILPKKDRYMLNVRGGPATCSYVLEVTLEDSQVKSPRTQDAEDEPREPSPSPRGARP
jgi:hypothetical protein